MMHIPRAIIILFLLGMILVLGLTSSNNPAITNNSRHTFTWISHVTPELASWAKNLSFTDVVVADNSEQSYLNLTKEGITYWHFISSYALMGTDIERLKQGLTNFVNESPNGHVYLDDTNYFLEEYGVLAANNLFDAVRQVQATTNCKIITDGYMVSLAANLYSQVNLTEIDFDAYQPPTMSYDLIIPQLEMAHPRTIGVYLWAYPCAPTGVSWETMTYQNLESVYRQAEENNLQRLVIWNGYTEILQNYVCLHPACLYYYPEWWEKVKTENMKFLRSNP